MRASDNDDQPDYPVYAGTQSCSATSSPTETYLSDNWGSYERWWAAAVARSEEISERVDQPYFVPPTPERFIPRRMQRGAQGAWHWRWSPLYGRR